MRRLAGRVASMVLIATAAVGGMVITSPSASAATCSRDTGVDEDIDGDGHSDVAVGLPGYSAGSGAVDIRYTGLPAAVLRPSEVGGTAEAGAAFGSGVVIGDFDQDGCADLVVSSRRGIHLVFGSPTGLDLGSVITVNHPTGDGAGDDFGDSLAAAYRPTDRRQDGDHHVYDVFAGAPGTTVDGRPGAGAVWRYVITPGGPKRVTAAAGEQLTQNSPGVPGAAETGDRFGEELATDLDGGVVTSAPMEDLGAAVDAGAIWHLRADRDTGAWTTSQAFSQNSTGVPGAAENGDHFGSALSSWPGYLVVGVPDEDAGRKKDSGLVQVFLKADIKNVYGPGRMIHQDSPGLPGVIEAGDRFGAGVAAGIGISCMEGGQEMVIGAPGEDVGPRSDAGTITLVSRKVHEVCADSSPVQPRVLRQGSGLNGAAEAGDRVGSSLSLSIGRTDFRQAAYVRVLVGVPLEDLGAGTDAGMVLSRRPEIKDAGRFLVDGRTQAALTFSGGPVAAARYGQVLSSSFLD